MLASGRSKVLVFIAVVPSLYLAHLVLRQAYSCPSGLYPLGSRPVWNDQTASTDFGYAGQHAASGASASADAPSDLNDDVAEASGSASVEATGYMPFPPARGAHRQSDRIDTLASYAHAEECGISSLDLHLPFEPLCPDRATLLEAMSTGGRPGYDRPYIPSGCDMRWFSAEETEDILGRFSHVFIVGDSMLRHLTQALYILLRGDLAYGGITDWDVPSMPEKNVYGPANCACAAQFTLQECSSLAIRDYRWLVGNVSQEDAPISLQEGFDMTFHELHTWPLPDEDLDEITKSISDPFVVPTRPYVFIFHHSLWNDVNTTATLKWLSQIQDHITSTFPWLHDSDVLFPQLYMTANAGGLAKSPIYMATQSNAHLAKFEREIRPDVEEMGIEFLGMFNMSVQTTQIDGTHASFETNLLKAQMVLNWMDRLDVGIHNPSEQYGE